MRWKNFTRRLTPYRVQAVLLVVAVTRPLLYLPSSVMIPPAIRLLHSLERFIQEKRGSR